MRTIETLGQARAAIREIDRAIDANRAVLLSRCTRKPKHWLTWGRAWERNPDLKERDHQLFWLRGEVQIIRSRLEARAGSARQAAETRRLAAAHRKAKCPTCGTLTYAA